MARDLISRYVWIVDTINRHGRITRKRLNELWLISPYSDGRPIPERTFFNYRRAIEDNFHIDILCTPAGEYYIESPDSDRDKAFSNWLLDSYAIREAIDSKDNKGSLVMVDEVPSAREFLPTALEAAKENRRIRFAYAGFNRSRVEENILFEPYMLRLYRQRWYMVGYKVSSSEPQVRTYALDRVKSLSLTDTSFLRNDDFDAEVIFGNIIGVSSSKAQTKIVRLKTSSSQAKYLRALPLHSSQSEEIGHDHSIFTYHLKLNYELAHEILSMGAEVQVLSPPELRAMIIEELRNLNKIYSLTL